MVAGVASMSVHLFKPPRDVAVHRQSNLCRPCSDGFLPDHGPCVRDTDNGEVTTTKTLRARRTQRPTPLPSFPLLQPKLRPQCQVSSTSFTPSSPRNARSQRNLQSSIPDTISLWILLLCRWRFPIPKLGKKIHGHPRYPKWGCRHERGRFRELAMAAKVAVC